MKLPKRPLRSLITVKHQAGDSVLLEALNGKSFIPFAAGTTQRMTTLVEQLQELDSIRDLLRRALGPIRARHRDYELITLPSNPLGETLFGWSAVVNFNVPQRNAANRRGKQLLLKINKTLSRYRQTPTVQIMNDLSMKTIPSFRVNIKRPRFEQYAIESILEAIRRGDLLRYRRCKQCGETWFYAARDQQRFCKEACRKLFASRSEVFKEKRRIYMRNYRSAPKYRADSEGRRGR